jgi:multidrug efflux pump subunit AcrA (membrane-fusion protein)
MTPPRAHARAAIAAAGLLALTAAALGATGPTGPRAATPPPVPVAGASPAPPARAEAAGRRQAAHRDIESDADARPVARSVRADRDVAQGFLAAFLHYELGELSAKTLRRLRATAAPALTAELLAAPPHPPNAGPAKAATVHTMEAIGTDRVVTEFEVLLRRGDRRTLLTVTLGRRHGRPWVTALR